MKVYWANVKMLVMADSPEAAAAEFVKSLGTTPALFRVQVKNQSTGEEQEIPYFEAMHDAMVEAASS